MKLRVIASSSDESLYVDSIYLLCKNGKEILIDWDEAEFSYENGECRSRHKGVQFNGKYADGRINDVREAKLGDVCLYYSGAFGADWYASDFAEADYFKITSLIFEDYDEERQAYIRYELKIM